MRYSNLIPALAERSSASVFSVESAKPAPKALRWFRMSLPKFRIGIQYFKWVFAGHPILCSHCPPTEHTNMFESSVRVGLKGKRNKLKRSEYQSGLTARLERTVNRSYKYRSDNEKLQGEIALHKRPGGTI